MSYAFILTAAALALLSAFGSWVHYSTAKRSMAVVALFSSLTLIVVFFAVLFALQVARIAW